MTKIIVIALQKGGVGKTTTSQHLAHGLAIRGRKVLMLDLDSQASLTNRYNIEAATGTISDVLGAEGPPTKQLREVVLSTYQEGLHLVPATSALVETEKRLNADFLAVFTMNRLLREQPLPFDYVVIDTAPGRSIIQLSALVAADEIIVPVQLSPMGFEGFMGIDEVIEQARSVQAEKGDVRLRYAAVVPTFYDAGQKVSDSFLATLEGAEHPDYEGQRLPLMPPVPETTAFEQSSASMLIGDVHRARTIFEVPAGGDSTPTARGQQAYAELARYIDEL